MDKEYTSITRPKGKELPTYLPITSVRVQPYDPLLLDIKLAKRLTRPVLKHRRIAPPSNEG